MNRQDNPELDETTRHRLLSDPQRRFVIESLDTAGRTDTTLGALASDLDRAAQRDDSVAADVRRNLRCRLHHVHLPMLSDAGLVDYDASTKRIRLRGRGAIAAVAASR